MGVPRRKWELALDARESGTSVFETSGGRTPADLPEHHRGRIEKWIKRHCFAELKAISFAKVHLLLWLVATLEYFRQESV